MAKEISFEQAAVELGVKSTGESKRREVVISRLVALGYVRDCSRCGGSGHFSYNQIHGTMCYGCNGRGKALMGITRKLLDEAVARQAAGELDALFAKNRANAEARRLVKPIIDQIDQEWQYGSVHFSYREYGLRTRDEKIGLEALKAQPEYIAANLINEVWRYAQDLRHKGLETSEYVEELKSVLEMIRQINTSWSDFCGTTP